MGRTKELEPIRKAAFEIWLTNPNIKASQLRTVLVAGGFDMTGFAKTTLQTWVTRWRLAKGKITEPIREKLQAALRPTWEQIIKAVPDIETLSMLVFSGIMKEIEMRDNAIETVKQENLQLQEKISQLKQALDIATRDKNKAMRDYNELLARRKIGTLNLDTVQHKLIRKE